MFDRAREEGSFGGITSVGGIVDDRIRRLGRDLDLDRFLVESTIHGKLGVTHKPSNGVLVRTLWGPFAKEGVFSIRIHTVGKP